MTPNPNLHLWLIPILPLIGATINGVFGKRFSRKTVSAVAWIFSGAAFVMALWIIAQFSSLTLPHTDPPLMTWIQSGIFHVDFAFYLDQLTLVMLLVVTGVGFLIHIYSAGYMWEDPGYYRFFSYLNLFLFFMLTLILASNYLVMFIGWEGVGLASYLLIGFWFTKDSAAAAGKKAFIVNRIGDFGFLIALFLIIQHFGSLDFTQVADAVKPLGLEPHGGLLTAIAILLMVGACGKSAQIPLYVWLPDAMEGPTPVSALIHAATMVTAGVYMVSRSHVIFERAPIALTVVAIIGTLTAFFAATIGITQTDIKKVLAYSTVSQLGYMFMACGAAAFSAGIFHLMTHAFFKGLLFLAAGSVIHAVGGEQDMRKMGGLRKKIPVTFWTMTAATFAIAGIPGLAGFFSKDEILWHAYQTNWIYWLIGVTTAFITSFYMFRLWFMTFFGEYRGEAESGHSGHSSHGDSHGHGHGGIHESPKVMLIPLVILAFLSVFGGYVGVPPALGGSNRFEKFLAPVFEHGTPNVNADNVTAAENDSPAQEKISPNLRTGHSTELILTGCSACAAFLGLFFAWLLYYKRPQLPQEIAQSLGGLYRGVLNKYYVDEIYAAVFVKPLVGISRAVFWQGIDRHVIDATLDDSAAGAREFSGVVRHMQSGNLRSYAGWIAFGAAVVIAYMIWMGTR
jgi:NADH-quinone oxidoreductase subunit L